MSIKKLTVSFILLILVNFSANALELKVPKIGGKKADISGAKLNFTKIFFESSLNYMEAQFHLFNALEMNDEASKTKKSIAFVKDTKNKVLSDTSNSWSNYQSSKSVLDATKAQLKAAEIANEGITLEYDSGNTRTTLEVIQSRSLLLEARIAYSKAQRDFVVSQFELAKQIGTLSQKSVK